MSPDPTTHHRWQQLKELFTAAIDLPPEHRPRFLEQHCPHDPDLRQQVLELLASHEQAGDFLEPPDPAEASDLVGQRLGPYRVVRRIASGGMGHVYLAERADGTFSRSVAIKVIRKGLDTDDLLRRFHRERHTLAILDHPHIARLIDAGAAPDGRPWIAMEYVPGQPIDEYCFSRNLPTRHRLELFIQICHAVHYAHQRLIVHRDLKPANVLITSDGTPKLLDFGIAAILTPDDTPDPTTQGTAFRPMTLEYASPEQIRGEPVTTASDVYSLGVVL